jgi:hypothetical protein
MHRTAFALAGLLALAAAIVVLTTRSAGGVINPVTAYDADINKDGHVGSLDLLYLAYFYKQPAPTPTPTPTPQSPHNEVLFQGPRTTYIGTLVSYTLSVRNFGIGPAYVEIRSLSSVLNGAPAVTCIHVGKSPTDNPSQSCVPANQFPAHQGTILPGETLWATFTGYFSGGQDVTLYGSWYWQNSSGTAGGAEVLPVTVKPFELPPWESP